MNNENVKADPKELRRSSVFLDSHNFVNPPGNSAIFEAKVGQTYKLREQLELRDNRGFYTTLKPGQAVKLNRIEHGTAIFDITNG